MRVLAHVDLDAVSDAVSQQMQACCGCRRVLCVPCAAYAMHCIQSSRSHAAMHVPAQYKPDMPRNLDMHVGSV